MTQHLLRSDNMKINPAALSALRPQPKAPSKMTALLQMAADMQVVRRDTSIPESAKTKMLEGLREQTEAIEDNVQHKAEKSERNAMVASAAGTEAVVRSADAESADAGQSASDDGNTPSRTSGSTPKATPSPIQTSGAIIDTYA
jgi:hypothetical protein